MMKRIIWLSTGGTIACTSGNDGLTPAACENQMQLMLEHIPKDEYEIIKKSIMNIDSSDISVDDILKIGCEVNTAISQGCDGIVITHGTDTMAYTCAMLSQMIHHSPVPVIVTGSQRPFFTQGSDAAQNLLNSFKAASDSRFNGIYLLFGDKVIKGDKAYKAYTVSDNAFISVDGYAAIIDKGGFINVNTADSCGAYNFISTCERRVMLIKLTPSSDSDIIDYAVRSGIRGIVIEGYGMGGIPYRLLDRLRVAVSCGIKIMLISQCMFEGIDLNVYEIGCSAAKCGIMSGGTMTAEAAMAYMMFNI